MVQAKRRRWYSSTRLGLVKFKDREILILRRELIGREGGTEKLRIRHI